MTSEKHSKEKSCPDPRFCAPGTASMSRVIVDYTFDKFGHSGKERGSHVPGIQQGWRKILLLFFPNGGEFSIYWDENIIDDARYGMRHKMERSELEQLRIFFLAYR